MVWQRNLAVLCIGVALSGSSYTSVIPFLPLYLLELGVPQYNVSVWSGAIFSSTFFVAALLAPYWGRQADRSGKKRMLLRAGFCLAVVYFLGSLVRSPYELLGMRVLQGVANGFVPASFAIVSSSVPEENMGTSLGFMQTGLLTGSILGPLLGGTLSHLYGMRQSFVIASLIIFLATLAAWLMVEEPKFTGAAKAGSIREDIKTALSNRSLLKMLVLLLLVQMNAMILQPLVTLYIAELQGTISEADFRSGLVFGLTGVAGAVAAPLWGKAGQRLGFHTVLITTLAAAGVINLSQFFVGSILQFSIVQFAFGFFIAGVLPAINAMVVASTDRGFRGRAFGLTTSANQLGSMLGPILGGFISSFFGIKAVFVFTGAVLLCAALAVWRDQRENDESSLETGST